MSGGFETHAVFSSIGTRFCDVPLITKTRRCHGKPYWQASQSGSSMAQAMGATGAAAGAGLVLAAPAEGAALVLALAAWPLVAPLPLLLPAAEPPPLEPPPATWPPPEPWWCGCPS